MKRKFPELFHGFHDHETKFMMLRIVVFIFVLLQVLYAEAQPAIHKSVTFGGTNHDWCHTFINSGDGGYYLMGTTRSSNGDVTGSHGEYDIWVVKIDSALNLQWQKSFGGSNWEDGFSGDLTFDGGCIVAGSTNSTDGNVQGLHGGDDFWVIKIGTDGDLKWQKCFGGKNDDDAASVRQTSDTGYIVAGSSYSTDGNVTGNHGLSDFWVIKLDKGGNLQWQKSLGGSRFDDATSVIQTSDGGYLVAGHTESNDGDVTGHHGEEAPYYNDSWVVKLDGAGTLQWQKCFGGKRDDGSESLVQTTDGGYVIAGYSESSDGDLTGNHGGADCWIIKIDSLGTMQWQKSLGGSGWDFATSVLQTKDKGYIFGGYVSSSNWDITGKHEQHYDLWFDGWLVKLDSLGNLQWQKCLGGTYDDRIYSVQKLVDGRYAIAGYSESSDYDVSENKGMDDFWFAEFSEITMKITHPTCGQHNGSATAIPGTDGIPPFSYFWSTGQTTESIFGLSPGNYSVTITDSAGHVSDGSFSVVNEEMKGRIYGKDASCWFCTDGSVTIEATGGSGKYFYSWEGFPDDTTATLTGLSRGTYHGCATDRTGCRCCYFFIVNSPVGIDDPEIEILQIRIIPNPAEDYFTVALSGKGERLDISIFNLQGEEIFKQQFKGENARIDIRNLTPGVYFVRIGNEKAIGIQKLIKR
jgi:hypothetical protein